ncbi:Phosphatase-like protein (PTPLA) [Penicillium chermesinum]|uniref:Very-long-chain (3R)-3-hydroxyacyl-CoA dehydratase n=1 Tax=Penicillium chermesinum TaxID=63820 RepID=A0A9W9NDT3_9EURO|nr:Phosphatase-like protein (PTPLA) [Penicillium chermesinum]KAJ5216998.1 Phosphatase-like protein (PTPLA) [Penicillium chermesinum]
MASTASSAPRASGPTGITRAYLFLYNLVNFLTWGYTVVYTASWIPGNANKRDLGTVFNHAWEVVWYTQLIAGLEIVHSLLGIVRAPFFTTAMQVASRLLVTMGILQQFGPQNLCGKSTAQIGDFAYIGCVFAWGITEIIRYGYFVITSIWVPSP